jgi:hypothetical protein
METTDKLAAQTAKDMERAYKALADGPKHIHAICTKLKIDRKSSRARRLYLGVKADKERFARSSDPRSSVWMRA